MADTIVNQLYVGLGLDAKLDGFARSADPRWPAQGELRPIRAMRGVLIC